MKVIVYVEGPSDKLAMEGLLRPVIYTAQQKGVKITFHEAPPGDRKKSVLLKVPVKAINILGHDKNSVVIALPDLYPADKGFPHRTFEELRDGIFRNFQAEIIRKKIADKSIVDRFKVFCFKYDLEALLLAAKDALASRLGEKNLKVTWKLPVEDQNHANPPKFIIRELFTKHGEVYTETVDAPLILSASNLNEIVTACPQCFKPFVTFLENLSASTAGS